MSKRRWFAGHTPKIDPDELGEIAEESLKSVREQQPHVNALTNFLNNRKGQNGFGEDFDITFKNSRRA